MYLIFEDEKAARARSAEAWEQVLGRKKHPEDVTEFLWDIDVGKDGRTALVIDGKAELLKPSEDSATILELPEDEWERVEPPPPAETGEITVEP